MAALDRLPQRDARVAVDERCTRRFPTREAVPRASPRRHGPSFDFRVAASSHTLPGLDGTSAVRLPPRRNRRDLAAGDLFVRKRRNWATRALGSCKKRKSYLSRIASIGGKENGVRRALTRRVEVPSSFFLIEVRVLSYAHALSILPKSGARLTVRSVG